MASSGLIGGPQIVRRSSAFNAQKLFSPARFAKCGHRLSLRKIRFNAVRAMFLTTASFFTSPSRFGRSNVREACPRAHVRPSCGPRRFHPSRRGDPLANKPDQKHSGCQLKPATTTPRARSRRPSSNLESLIRYTSNGWRHGGSSDDATELRLHLCREQYVSDQPLHAGAGPIIADYAPR